MKRFHVYMEPSLYQSLRDLAKENERPVASELRRALRRHVQSQPMVVEERA